MRPFDDPETTDTDDPNGVGPANDERDVEDGQPIRLVLVEPRAIHAAGVRELLEREPDMEVVAQVRSPEEAVGAAGTSPPDVLIVDVDLPDPDAVEATRRLKREMPGSAMVILGHGSDDESVFRAVQAGAAAHVVDEDSPQDLVETIRRVADGEDPLVQAVGERPAVAERVADAYRELAVRGPAPTSRSNPLSPRQREILAMVAQGNTNSEIASTLGLSLQTVKNHLTAIMRTVGARRRSQAVMTAARSGWLTIDSDQRQRPPTRRERRRD
jgi:DNA-binding NarL/FixJ family response regulator